MAEQGRVEVGLIGLGVMGCSLALNLRDQGLGVCCFSINPDERAKARQAGLVVADELSGMLAELPDRKLVLLMITAGAPVDEVLGQLLEVLQPGDIVIDGGNSWYADTQRRSLQCQERQVGFVGAGISGGEQGARHGASIMAGGTKQDFEHIKPVLAALACEVRGEPCYGWLGQGGAGHFVKMVHNGIEYGVMQLIAEVYDLCRRGIGLPVGEIRDWLVEQQGGPLNSYLLDITCDILARSDDLSDGLLLDRVSDQAGQKGTGRWCVDAAMSLGVPVPAIVAAVTERQVSGSSALRQALSGVYTQSAGSAPAWRDWQEDLADALLGAMITTFAQGLALIQAASAANNWETDVTTAVKVWRGGCIIRAALLDEMLDSGVALDQVDNLLLAPAMAARLQASVPGWRRVMASAVQSTVPVPGLGANLAYLDSITSARLPTHLIQAQRDCFGAHGFERTDQPGRFHVQWTDGS